MVKRSMSAVKASDVAESDHVFELAAEVFRVMSAPMRLKIISALCNGEKNVTQLLDVRFAARGSSTWLPAGGACIHFRARSNNE